MAIVGSFMGEMCLNIRFKGFLELICSRLVQSNPDFIILNIKISKLHDFLIFGPIINGLFSLFMAYLWIDWLIYGLLIFCISIFCFLF